MWGNQRSRKDRQKTGARSWCHTYLFSMSLLLFLNDINHHWNFKGKSRVTRCENSKSRITRLIWARSSITLKIWVPSRVTENLYHPVKSGWKNGHPCYSSFQQFISMFYKLRCHCWNKIPAPAGSYKDRAFSHYTKCERKTHTFVTRSRGVTWVNFCRVCAAGLSEPLHHHSLFCVLGKCNLRDPNLWQPVRW